MIAAEDIEAGSCRLPLPAETQSDHVVISVDTPSWWGVSAPPTDLDETGPPRETNHDESLVETSSVDLVQCAQVATPPSTEMLATPKSEQGGEHLSFLSTRGGKLFCLGAAFLIVTGAVIMSVVVVAGVGSTAGTAGVPQGAGVRL